MALLHCNFYSSVLGLASSMDVILPQEPPGKADSSQRKLPTLYLLHGLSDDHTTWQRRTSIERYVASMRLAVVIPAVGRSWYTDMLHGLRYWTFISEELPAICRSFFNLSDAREDTFVAGLSMGGYGAFKLALRRPHRFAAAASLSGALDVVERANRAKAEKLEDKLREMRAIVGDPFAIKGTDNDLFHLAYKLAKSKAPKPRLYQWCGTEDYLYEDNLRFRAHAKALSLPLVYEEGPGMHEWSCWDRMIRRVLEWLPVTKS